MTNENFLIAVFCWFAMIVVVVYVHDETTSLSAEQKVDADLQKLNKTEYLTKYCGYKKQYEDVCKQYIDIRLSCADAGIINKCINIRMKSADYSACDENGKVFGIADNLMPSTAQCFLNNFN